MPPVAPILAVAGLNSMATRLSGGAISRRNSSHLLPMVASKLMKPVALPPGCARRSRPHSARAGMRARHQRRDRPTRC